MYSCATTSAFEAPWPAKRAICASRAVRHLASARCVWARARPSRAVLSVPVRQTSRHRLRRRSRIRREADRGLHRGGASIPDLAPMWWMRISVVSAHGPPTRPWFAPELLNDLGVMVVGFACSRVRLDLLQHLAAARPLGCSALGLPEYPLIQTSQIGGNRRGPGLLLSELSGRDELGARSGAIGPGRSRKAQ